MNIFQSLLEKARGTLQGTRNGPTITTHPKLEKVAKDFAAKGQGMEALEERMRASFSRQIYIGVAEKEQQAVTPTPEVLEQLRQHQQDAAREPDVVKEETEKHEKHKACDLELFVNERCSLAVKNKKRDLKAARQQAKKSRHIYKGGCKEEAVEPTGHPIKKPSTMIHLGKSIAVFAVEGAANYEAFLAVFRSNLASTVTVALGCSLGVTMLAKFVGTQLAGLKESSPNRKVALMMMVGTALAAAAFSILVGMTRGFGDPQHPIPSIWGKLAAAALNLFLFIGMVAVSWSYTAKKALATKLNALLENKLRWEKAVQSLQAELDSLELATVDKKIDIEHGYRPKFEEAKKVVRDSGLKVAKVLGEHHARLASIDRDALVMSAALSEAVWGLRIQYQLGMGSNGTPPTKPVPGIDPCLFAPSSEKTVHPENQEVSPNP